MGTDINTIDKFLIVEFEKYFDHLELVFDERRRVSQFFLAVASSPIVVGLGYLLGKDSKIINDYPNLRYFFNYVCLYLGLGLTVMVLLMGIAFFLQYIWLRVSYQEKLKHTDNISRYFKNRYKNTKILLTGPQKSEKPFYFSLRADFFISLIFAIPNSFYFAVIVGFLWVVCLYVLTDYACLSFFDYFKYLSIPVTLFSVIAFIGLFTAHILLYYLVLKFLELGIIKRYPGP